MAQEIILSEAYRVPSKTEIAHQVKQITDQVADGNINPLRAFGLLSALEKAVGEAKKNILDLALMEADKYPEKDKSVYGATFTIKETGVKYDYSDDPKWAALQERIEDLRAKQKGIETTLRMQGKYAKSSTTTLQIVFSK